MELISRRVILELEVGDPTTVSYTHLAHPVPAFVAGVGGIAV